VNVLEWGVGVGVAGMALHGSIHTWMNVYVSVEFY